MLLRAALAVAALTLSTALAVPAGATPAAAARGGGVGPSQVSQSQASRSDVSAVAQQRAVPPGTRIIRIARRLVGDRYRSGGASPKTGFDCSGLTKYVYARARVARLPHNAERQRRMHHMRQIGVRRARPGDLVFYMSGGHAYHVAIYAGRHMQYAAATPRDGVRYQAVWSKRVQYRTIWH